MTLQKLSFRRDKNDTRDICVATPPLPPPLRCPKGVATAFSSTEQDESAAETVRSIYERLSEAARTYWRLRSNLSRIHGLFCAGSCFIASNHASSRSLNEDISEIVRSGRLSPGVYTHRTHTETEKERKSGDRLESESGFLVAPRDLIFHLFRGPRAALPSPSFFRVFRRIPLYFASSLFPPHPTTTARN